MGVENPTVQFILTFHMPGYELSRLNDKEFEALATHIVSGLTSTRVERFKPGKDQGVDGRFFVVGHQEGIVQAKHWEKTGVVALRAYLTKTEAPKVAKLKPARYLLVTSVHLGRSDKQSISDIFSPYIKSPADILGNEDIQDYLRDHPEIARQHYKLWLASAEVLTLMFNAPIIGRSTFKTDEVIAFSPKYVATQSHQEALKLLDEMGSIIIIGEPGIGKSTLAEQLVLNYAVDGYELCFVQNALEEAEGVWANDRKQIFYFDDFLGRNYLEAIGRNHDSHVLAFMRRVQKDKTKRFVLTSRTTIMQQGKSLSELFRVYNIDQKEFEIRITDLSAIEKARILYNHIWFGDLGPEFVEQLYVDKRYNDVVAHRNFNPRLISFITDTHKIAGIPDQQYWQYVKATLENPRDVWRGVFDNQLDRMGRLIVTLVVFHGGEISERELRSSCERARQKETPKPSASEWGLAFERSYQMSVGAIVTRQLERFSGSTTVGLFNPSVGDFVLHRFASDVASLESFLVLLRDRRALVRFNAIRRNGIVSYSDYCAVMQMLAAHFWPDWVVEPEFAGILTAYVIQEQPLISALDEQLTALAAQIFDIARASDDAGNLCPFAAFVLEEKLMQSDDARWPEFVQLAMDGTEDDDTLIELSKVVVLLSEPMMTGAASELARHVIECWKEKIDHEISQHGIASDYFNEDDHDKVEADIQKFIRDTLKDYSIEFDDEEIAEIVSDFDIDQKISDNIRSDFDDEGGNRYRFSESKVSSHEREQIDDLFERERGS
jgi:hypothetical protein